MSSSKHNIAVSKLMALLKEWDGGAKSVRRRILQDFIAQNYNKTAPELEAEFAEAASLFLTRLCAWLRLTYMIGTCACEQLQALQIFLSTGCGHRFLGEFLEIGGVLTVIEMLGLKHAREDDKAEALQLLICIANAGRQYKELICESYGIRAVAECMAKSRSEKTQERCRYLLQTLAEGNPKFKVQVYKGLIALLPSSSPKAQQMAAQTLRIVQPIVGVASQNIVEPLLLLLKTLHLEVQYEAIEMIVLLMDYEVRSHLLQGLVKLLRPSKEDMLNRPELFEDDVISDKISSPLSVYIQQAAAAKCIGILVEKSSGCNSYEDEEERKSTEVAEELLQHQIVTNLMFAMGNVDYADSQRQSSKTFQQFCKVFSDVDEIARSTMGDVLYDLFMLDSESLYTRISAVQADVLVSNEAVVSRKPSKAIRD